MLCLRDARHVTFFVVFFLFVCLFCLFAFGDRVSLYSPGCPGTQLCRPGWPRTQKSACLCLPSAGIKGVRHHAWLIFMLFMCICWYQSKGFATVQLPLRSDTVLGPEDVPNHCWEMPTFYKKLGISSSSLPAKWKKKLHNFFCTAALSRGFLSFSPPPTECTVNLKWFMSWHLSLNTI